MCNMHSVLYSLLVCNASSDEITALLNVDRGPDHDVCGRQFFVKLLIIFARENSLQIDTVLLLGTRQRRLRLL